MPARRQVKCSPCAVTGVLSAGSSSWAHRGVTSKGFRTTCSRPRGAGTFRLTASRPMSGPGQGSSPGRRLRVSIPAVFLFLLPWRPIGSWETARTRRASNKSGPRFPLPTNTGTSRIRSRKSSPAPQGAPDSLPTPLRYLSASRLFKNSAEWLWLRPRVPPRKRPLPDRLPV
jgi:hypothetical protein